MRSTFLLIACIVIFPASGQLSGEVAYITKINMHRDMPDDERGKRMKEWIPEFTEFNNLLLFTSGATLYKNIHEEEEDVNLDEAEGQSGGHWRKYMLKRMAPANDIIYTDVEKGFVTEKKEFMDKVFLIRDTIRLSNWKLTGEQKQVSGLSCMRAEYIPPAGDSTKMFVWFTPEIPVSSGPAGNGGLPGLIVYLNAEDGKMTISLDNIVMREIGKDEIVEPKKGKEVTREEYTDMVMKKREQQRQQWEGRGDHHR